MAVLPVRSRHLETRRSHAKLLAIGLLVVAVLGVAKGEPAAAEQQFAILVCPPSPGNVRNTEASMVRLRDGRLLLAYTRFRGGGDDNDSADIAGKSSADGGRSWSAPFVLKQNDGRMNVMSASVLRLSTGELMLGYLRKNSTADCSFCVRKSKDETTTWGDEILVTKDNAYHVVNNDRIVELKNGRLLVPTANHGDYRAGKPAFGLCYMSDDHGETWRAGNGVVRLGGVGCQEPGVVELEDGRIFMIIRTSLGRMYQSWSPDGGDTWSEPVATALRSPTAPASIKRIPKTGELLLIWNNSPSARRVPLTSAISRDEGKTWVNLKDIEPDGAATEKGSFAYTSILFVEDAVFLTYWTRLPAGLGLMLRAAPVSWLSTCPPPATRTQEPPVVRGLQDKGSPPARITAAGKALE